MFVDSKSQAAGTAERTILRLGATMFGGTLNVCPGAIRRSSEIVDRTEVNLVHSLLDDVIGGRVINDA
jgi:hypothetical protein